MKSKRYRSIRGALAGTAIIVGGIFASRASGSLVVAYDANSGLAINGTSSNHYAQQITLAGVAGSTAIYGYSILGLDWSNVSAGAQSITIDLYSNADTSPTSSNALGAATLIDSSTTPLILPPGGNGEYDYTFSYGAVPIIVPSGTVTLAISLTTDATGATFSSAVGGIFSTGAPSIGSDTGFVWDDSNHDNIFTGAEQSALIGGANPSNIDVIVAIPEPASLAVFTGIAGLALFPRRARVRCDYAADQG